eukprot:8781903-Alexandrium_andersonii.AAC.2
MLLAFSAILRQRVHYGEAPPARSGPFTSADAHLPIHTIAIKHSRSRSNEACKPASTQTSSSNSARVEHH